MAIYIESERIFIKNITKEELNDFQKVCRQNHICHWCPDWKNSEEWIEPWFKGIEWRYEINNPMEEFLLYGIYEKSTGKVIGKISIGQEFKKELPGEMSIGYFIDENLLCQGYATEAAKVFTEYYFNLLDIPFLYAVVKPDNIASNRVAEKAGFTLIKQIPWIRKRKERFCSITIACIRKATNQKIRRLL